MYQYDCVADVEDGETVGTADGAGVAVGPAKVGDADGRDVDEFVIGVGV